MISGSNWRHLNKITGWLKAAWVQCSAFKRFLNTRRVVASPESVQGFSDRYCSGKSPHPDLPCETNRLEASAPLLYSLLAPFYDVRVTRNPSLNPILE